MGRQVLRSSLPLASLLGAMLPQALLPQTALAEAATRIESMAQLPKPVARVYETLCAPDYWIGGKRVLTGSSSATFSDGTKVYLLVCGDAASVVPFTAVVMDATDAAREAKFLWRMRGKKLSDTGVDDAAFGAAPNTVTSRSHASATCEPAYTHRWTGKAFELVQMNRGGCKRGE